MKVLIASGGSGGHIFPALSLAKELGKDSVEMIFVASNRTLDRKLLEGEPYKKIYLTANPMPYRFGIGYIAFVFKLFLDSLRALIVLLRFRPDIVVGFGGYTSGAALLMGRFLRIKTVIHEQNVVPGRTNRFLEKYMDAVCVSFRETGKHFRNRNVVFTGNPLREESLREKRKEAFERLGLEEGKMTILVMGGSQGARSLNDLVSKSLSLLPKEKKEGLQLIHIAGAKNEERIRDIYEKSGVRGRVFAFMRSINEAYSACDMAISRSGSAAIFELAAFRKPMVLIPYPNEKNNQRFNAAFFQKKGAAIYRDEKELCETDLKGLIAELIDNPDKRKSLSENAGRLSVTNGAERLKEAILKLK